MRAAVATFAPEISNAERLQILDKTLAVDELADRYDQARDDGSNLGQTIRNIAQTYFSSLWSTDGGETPAFCLGVYLVDQAQWARLQAILAAAPSGFRYARWSERLIETNDVRQVVGSEYTGAGDAISAFQLQDYTG